MGVWQGACRSYVEDCFRCGQVLGPPSLPPAGQGCLFECTLENASLSWCRRFIDEQSAKWRAEINHLKECWASELKALNNRRLQHLEQLK